MAHVLLVETTAVADWSWASYRSEPRDEARPSPCAWWPADDCRCRTPLLVEWCVQG